MHYALTILIILELFSLPFIGYFKRRAPKKSVGKRNGPISVGLCFRQPDRASNALAKQLRSAIY